MRKRVVSSTGEGLRTPLNGEAIQTITSPAMKMAASFAAQFSIVAQFPAVQIFTSGTPHENGALFCDTPERRDLLRCIEDASVISILLDCGVCTSWDGADNVTAICEINFKRGGQSFATRTFYFERSQGDCICVSKKGQ